MTSLNENIPIEFVKKSEKLQSFYTEKFYIAERFFDSDGEWKNRYNIGSFPYTLNEEDHYKAPTTADVIDNAEMLFGMEEVYCDCCCNNKILVSIGCSEGEYLLSCNHEIVSITILTMCQQDKSIEEISQYIIDNIKEAQNEKEKVYLQQVSNEEGIS